MLLVSTEGAAGETSGLCNPGRKVYVGDHGMRSNRVDAVVNVIAEGALTCGKKHAA